MVVGVDQSRDGEHPARVDRAGTGSAGEVAGPIQCSRLPTMPIAVPSATVYCSPCAAEHCRGVGQVEFVPARAGAPACALAVTSADPPFRHLPRCPRDHRRCRPVSCQLPTTRSPSQPTSANATIPSSDERTIAPKSCSETSSRAVVVDEPADAGLALAEEEVADDRADHRQARARCEARRRSPAARPGTRASEPRPAARAVQREEVVGPGRPLRSPNSVFVIIGNSAIRTQTSTRLRKSKPNQKPISGTIARIGMVCSTTA